MTRGSLSKSGLPSDENNVLKMDLEFKVGYKPLVSTPGFEPGTSRLQGNELYQSCTRDI